MTAILCIGPIPGPLAEAFQEFGHIRYWRFNADYAIKPNLLNHFTVGINQRKLGEGPNLGLPDSYRTATLLPGVVGSGAEKAPNYTKYNTEFGNYGGHVYTESPSRTINFSDHTVVGQGSSQPQVRLHLYGRELSPYRLQQLRRLLEL